MTNGVTNEVKLHRDKAKYAESKILKPAFIERRLHKMRKIKYIS